MVQNGGKIGRDKFVRYDCLHRPILGGGIVNVDRRWVDSVRIENVDGVCKLAAEIDELFGTRQREKRKLIPGRGNRWC